MSSDQVYDQLISWPTFIALVILILLARDLYEAALDVYRALDEASYLIGQKVLSGWDYLGVVIARQLNKRVKD